MKIDIKSIAAPLMSASLALSAFGAHAQNSELEPVEPPYTGSLDFTKAARTMTVAVMKDCLQTLTRQGGNSASNKIVLCLRDEGGVFFSYQGEQSVATQLGISTDNSTDTVSADFSGNGMWMDADGTSKLFLPAPNLPPKQQANLKKIMRAAQALPH